MENSNQPQSGNGSFLDWKTVALGACALLLVLSQSLGGFWDRRTEQAVHDLRAALAHYGERLLNLEEAAVELRGKVGQNERDIAANMARNERTSDDVEARLRALERAVANGRQGR